MAREFTLSGVVGIDFDAETVSEALAYGSGPVRIRLNSGGGIAFDGAAIHSVLADYKGHVTIVVQGIAASAASVIMMAGDRIEMSAGSILMIHDPSQDMTSYRGTSEEHRRVAASLDKISEAVAHIYAQRSSKPISEIRQIMSAESWFTPDEAVSAGFADVAVSDGEPASPAEFDYRAYAHSPTNLIQMSVHNHWINDFTKGAKMAKQSTAQTKTAAAPVALPDSLAPVMAAADRSDPRKELERVKGLTQLATSEFGQRVDALSRLDGWISEGVTLDAARTFVMNEVAAQNAPPSKAYLYDSEGGRNSVGHSWDGGDGLTSKIVDGIYSRVNRNHKPTMGREYAGASLSEVADICLQQCGKSTAMASVASRVEMALHGTSDFPNILRDVGNMSLSHAYEAAQSAIKQTSREIAASNFRGLHSVKVSAGSDLEEVNEQGEFKSGTIEEGAETFAVKTYGKIFGITRQAIVNDDLDVFSNMFPLLGQGAAGTEAKLFARLLEENAGLGPKLSDGKTLFHTAHGNLAPSASALSVTSLGAARVAMRRQTGIAGEAINVVPAFLVVPPELETLAEQVLTEIAASANPFAGKLKLLVEPRFTSASAWYLCAAPGAPDSLQHAYLDGATGPQLFTREGFEVDGIEYKVRMDFGAGFTDHRGWYMSPSA
ncbi:head maturation protease, ClpP-related [Sedimentitalea nanhaiensis]|uniref:ATP-dependent Clp protease proteolytic subunit n=1 Tax=Sedimentitalea nanhaiensis TaxID=999627 RepID=A0A1I7CL23_9RHOB|nr:head maturation protease, ClpP-related [Sedimentitalea nanhaiensis]SFU00125.1 ATP-dependent protease ClpP, protease subunit [Sedimentitalea nanhaiensis]